MIIHEKIGSKYNLIGSLLAIISILSGISITLWPGTVKLSQSYSESTVSLLLSLYKIGSILFYVLGIISLALGFIALRKEGKKMALILSIIASLLPAVYIIRMLF